MDYSLIESKLIWATQRVIDPVSRQGQIFLDGVPAWLIRRGRVVVRFCDGITEAKAGQWIFPKEGTAYYDFTPKAVLLSLRFRLQWPNGRELFERTRSLIVPDKEFGDLRHAAESFAVYYPKEHPPLTSSFPNATAYFAQQSGFNRWLEAYSRVITNAGMRIRTLGRMDQQLLSVREFMDGLDLATTDLNSELVARGGLDLGQLIRRFGLAYGVTPRRYFERRRFVWVRSELNCSERTIKEIAAAVGFNNLAQFSNWFRRLSGVAPRNYRSLVQV